LRKVRVTPSGVINRRASLAVSRLKP